MVKDSVEDLTEILTRNSASRSLTADKLPQEDISSGMCFQMKVTSQ